MSEPWVPTINDLRVKLCYICREEERHDTPEDPPRAWTHPCNCTLIAHESCLLKWIKSAQQNPDRAANALKCPQCGARYELESNNPLTLRLLDAWNRGLSRVGKVVTVSCVGIIAISFGAGVYAICTSYGAHALQQFLGKEVFDTILTDDPSNWPWHAFLNLPLIPLSLIVSRTPLFTTVSPLIPLLFAWPTSVPVASAENVISARWAGAEGVARSLFPPGPALWWPPSPTLVCALFPFVRTLYTNGLARLTHRVMHIREMPAPPVRRLVWALNDGGPGQGASVGEFRETDPSRARV